MSRTSGSFFDELKRRRVFRVAVVYIIAGWAFIQAADLIFPRVGLPDWTVTAAVVVTLLGFPVALSLAWAFDIGPAGVVRDQGWRKSAGAHPHRAAAAWAGLGAIIAIVGLGAYATISGSGGGVVGAPPGADLATGSPSIAVLPFVDLSEAGDQEYFADGITEEILNALAQVSGLHVAARTSSFSFKGQNVPVDSIAHRLGVRTVLEGSLRKEGDRVRITAQLIDALSGFHMWSENFDREVSDVFAIQDEISRAIAQKLSVELGLGAGQALVEAATASPEAHDAYLKGLYHWNKRTGPDIRRAAALFHDATALDPGYADAWVGLGASYELLPLYDPAADQAESVRLARASVERALELQPENGRAHAVLGDLILHYDWDVLGSEREHRMALRLAPNDATVHAWLAEAISGLGRTKEAVEEGRKAVALDPLDPKINADLGWLLYLDRQFEASRRQLERGLELDPDHFYANVVMGALLQSTEDYDGARQIYQHMLDAGVTESLFWPDLGVRVMDAALDPALRRDGLAAAREAVRRGDILGGASFYIALGEPDSALVALESAVEGRWNTMASFLVEPVLDPIRNDPRFSALERRVRELAPLEEHE